MGQQQLLLVILVTILVGIATVVAINIFGTAADQANRDAVRQDLLAAVGQAQAIWQRPSAMGGYGQSFDPDDVDFDIRRLNIPRSSDPTDTYEDDEIVNDNGTYTVVSGEQRILTLQGLPQAGGGAIQVTLTREAEGGGDTGAWEIEWTEL